VDKINLAGNAIVIYFRSRLQMLMKKTEWFNRKFDLIEDTGRLPTILERLEGTTVRIENIIRQLDKNQLIHKTDDKWSIQEEVGHLSDLEPLWLARVHELIKGTDILQAADLKNQKTHQANHNAKDIQSLLDEFKSQRNELVTTIRNMTDEQQQNTSLHPRLKTPMRVVDLAFFVAEHDDHHLATMREKMGK
jgi:uncharacterized damage-inducible protein DinB